jgi:hypothetical protein
VGRAVSSVVRFTQLPGRATCQNDAGSQRETAARGVGGGALSGRSGARACPVQRIWGQVNVALPQLLEERSGTGAQSLDDPLALLGKLHIY